MGTGDSQSAMNRGIPSIQHAQARKKNKKKGWKRRRPLHEARALVAMSENLKKHVQEAIQGKKEVKVTFKAWLAI